jgi:hypothetical protein
MSALHSLSDNDRAALQEAAELAKAVVARHPHEVNGQIVTVLLALVHDVDVLTKLLDVGGGA